MTRVVVKASVLVGDLATQDVVDSHRDGAWDAKYLARAIRTKYSLG